MALNVETCVAQHLGDRKEQQDQVGLFAHPRRPGMVLAALADGMGGHSGGAMAAEQVVLKARQNFEEFAPIEESGADLVRGILTEAHLIIKLTRITSEQEPHSTGVVFLLQPGRADWAHCGDSRLYHYRGTSLHARSQDHSLVGELVRKGRIDEEGARSHPQRNVLLSCLGSERPPRIEAGSAEQLLAGDSFLLCSDGLWGHFRDNEIGMILGTQSARRSAQILVERARERAAGRGDNLSLAVIKLVAVEG